MESQRQQGFTFHSLVSQWRKIRKIQTFGQKKQARTPSAIELKPENHINYHPLTLTGLQKRPSTTASHKTAWAVARQEKDDIQHSRSSPTTVTVNSLVSTDGT